MNNSFLNNKIAHSSSSKIKSQSKSHQVAVKPPHNTQFDLQTPPQLTNSGILKIIDLQNQNDDQQSAEQNESREPALHPCSTSDAPAFDKAIGKSRRSVCLRGFN